MDKQEHELIGNMIKLEHKIIEHLEAHDNMFELLKKMFDLQGKQIASLEKEFATFIGIELEDEKDAEG